MLTVFWKGYKMVHFVGAGSGAADLITIRGKKLLKNADIIIYAGSLVNPELLEYAKDSAEIYNSAKMNLDEVIDVMKQGDTKTLCVCIRVIRVFTVQFVNKWTGLINLELNMMFAPV